MKRKLALLLVVIVFCALTAGMLVACDILGGSSTPPNRNTPIEDHGYAVALVISSPAGSRSSAIFVDEFKLSDVKAKVRFAKEIYNEETEEYEYEYWTDPESEFSLTEDMIVDTRLLSDPDLLSQKRNDVQVSFESKYKDADGYKVTLEGVFKLFLKVRDTKEYCTITFDTNGGIPLFAGKDSEGLRSVDVEKGTTYTWAEFITTYPVMPPTRQKNMALVSWGSYNSSTTSIVISADITLRAEYTQNSLQVSFDINNDSTDTLSGQTPVAPDSQTVAVLSGFVIRPKTTEMEIFNGYDFVGWYKDKAGTEIWNFTESLENNGYTSNQNFTLYAKWAERTFTLQFNLLDAMLCDPELRAIALGETQLGDIVPTVDKYDFSKAAYITYTSDDGNIEFIPLENKIDNATTVSFVDRKIAITNTFSAGSYTFDYEGTTYYFTAPRTFEASQYGLQLVCAPLVISYRGLKSGDKYFITQNSATGAILLSLSDNIVESAHYLYKGKADDLNHTYFYSFKGWYKDITTTQRFDFNEGTSSKKVDVKDYANNESIKNTLYLYAKWELNETTQDKYFKDYLYKNNLTRKLDGTVRIDGIYDKSATIITIPSTISYDFGDGLRDYDVTEIGKKAFYGNSKVIQIDFADDSNITTIGDEAFAYCSNLASVALDKLTKVESIGSNILRSTKYLNDYKTGGVNKYLIVNGILTLYTGSQNEVRVDTTDLPSTVHTISTGAFANLPNLLQITISKNIKVIENLAFENCTSLTVVDFPIGTQIEKVGASAFFRTKWVNGTGYKKASVFDVSKTYYELDYDDTREFIIAQPEDEEDFEAGEYFEKEEAEDGYSSLILGPIYYRYTGDTSNSKTKAVIPAQVGGVVISKIAPNAFSGYSNITNIEFENIDNITSIGANAFSDTTWVSTPTDSRTAEEWGSAKKIISSDGFCIINGILVEYFASVSQANAFVVIPSNVKVIAEGAFSRHDDSRIEDVLFAAGITELEIEPYAFQGASSLKDISFIGEQLPKDIVLYKESLFTANNTLNENIKIYLETGLQELDAYVNSVKSENTTWKYIETLETVKLELDRITINTNVIPEGYIIRDAAADSLYITDTWLENRVSRNYTTFTAVEGDTGTELTHYNQAIAQGGNYYYSVMEAGVSKTYQFTAAVEGYLYEMPTTSEYKIYTGTTIKGGVYKIYNNGVANTENINIEELELFDSANNKIEMKGTGLDKSWKFSATDVPSTAAKAQYYFKTANSDPRIIYIYPGIDESTIEIKSLQEEYFTTDTSLTEILSRPDPNNGNKKPYVQFNLLNGKSGLTYRLDNKNGDEETINTTECKIYINNYSYSRGASKILNVEITYQGFAGANKYYTTWTYSSKVPEVKAFTQASAFLFPVNGEASNRYSECFFDLIYEDGSHKTIAMDKGGFVITKVYLERTHDWVVSDKFDTRALGLRTAKVTYGDLDMELTVLYSVYLGTHPEVYTFDYAVSNGEYVATITGISNSYKSSYDSTLMLPTTVVYDNHEYKVVSIGDGAFKNLTRLTAIYLSNTIETIGEEAFSGCTNLKDFYTFEVAEDKTTPLVEADDNYEFFVKPGDAKNVVEPYDEDVTYISRVYIKSINFKGMDEIVIPYTLDGKTGTETINTSITQLDNLGYETTDYSYNASYKYELTPTISYELVNDGTATRLECILNNETVFYGKIYFPDTEYYRTLAALLDEYYPDDPATPEVNEGIKFDIEFYEADRKGLPSTLNKFTYSDGTTEGSNWRTLKNYVIDACYRKGSVLMLSNANLPVSDDNMVYVPEHYSGSYLTTVSESTYTVYYDYELVSVEDGCFYKFVYDGADTIYLPYSIYNSWCDVTNLFLYAPTMAQAKIANPSFTDDELINYRSDINNNSKATVARYLYSGGSLMGTTYTYDPITNAVTNINSEYRADTANAIAYYFSSNIKYIGYNAFENCTSLENIDFTKATSLEVIESSAFSGCTNLNHIDLSKTKIDTINADVFDKCYALDDFTMSTAVKDIGAYAFRGCAFDVDGFKIVASEYTDLISDTLTLTDYAFYLANNVDSAAMMNKLLGTGYGIGTAQQELELADGTLYYKTYYVCTSTSSGIYSRVNVYYNLDFVFSRD